MNFVMQLLLIKIVQLQQLDVIIRLKYMNSNKQCWKLNQVLNQHQENVIALNLMKQSNQLISGDEGGSILIWSYIIINGFVNKVLNNIKIGLDVQFGIIMKICLYHVVEIRLLSFGLKKMNGSVNKQSKIILVLFIKQVRMNNKIKLYLVEIIN
ncbi:unnamed protein product [Paramecium pentaurelia]|uniref:Transmembrane protein n=1 Tax=Paramecium pentaurelia TaxID=43138 RepID=A0A8S1T1Z6_9CILI|nr:unnamed protein product [Paramecium pentaurelia]